MRRLSRWTAWVAPLLVALPLHASSDDDAPSVEALELSLVRALGRPLYLRSCAPCHGERGEGSGRAARDQHVPPRDLTRGEHRFRSTPYGTQPTTLDVYRVITKGLAGTPMPAFEDALRPAERWLLARYVSTLSRTTRPKAEPVLPTVVVEPPGDAESLARGAALFTAAQCTQCHGEAGRGDGPLATMLVDSEGRPAPPSDLTRTLKGGRGAVAVFRAVSTGLSGTPMTSFAPLLDEQQRWDVARYVASLAQPESIWSYLFGAPSAPAAAPPVDDTRTRARDLYGVCGSCHGPTGAGDAVHGVPRLAELDPRYVARQIARFQSGERGGALEDPHAALMRAMAWMLPTAEEIDAVAAHVGTLRGQLPPQPPAGDVARGRALFSACTACHGPAALGNPELGAPRLAGQLESYLVRQLVAFRGGTRGATHDDAFGAMMAPMAKSLVDEQALRDVAAYVASLGAP